MSIEDEYYHVDITVYKTQDINMLQWNKSCLLPTETKRFRYDQIIAVASKSCATDDYRFLSRGAALLYTTDRIEPYLTADSESVKVIMDRIEKNPFCCELGLNQVGSNRLYANYLKNNVYTNSNYIVLSNGVQLYISNEGVRKMKWLDKLRKRGYLKSCFFATKKEIREKHRKK